MGRRQKQTPRPRDGRSRFVRTPASVERDLRAINLKNEGKTWEEVAAVLGYGNRHNARRAVEAVIAAEFAKNTEAINELRAKLLAKVAQAEDAVWEVLDRRHVTVSQGKIMYYGNEPLLDDGPILQAVAAIYQGIDRQAKLTGAYTPVQIEAQVTTVDPAEVEFQEHVAEQRALRQAARKQEVTQHSDPAADAPTS